jgi:hypothetical protein
MKKLLLSFFISLSFLGQAQKYQPMDSNMVWRDYYYFKNMNGGCPAYCEYEVINVSFQFHGYNLNNGITWLKIYKSEIHSWNPCQNTCTSANFSAPNCTNKFLGYLWDDTLTKKVYFTNTLTANFVPTQTNVIYDFLNKNVGDSLTWGFINNGNPAQSIGNYKFKILNIDSMLFANYYHKMYTVQNNSVLPYPINVVEGIGSFRAVFSSIFSDFEYSSRLVCASKGLSGMAVTNPTAYTTGASGCGTINAVPEIKEETFFIHPNPVSTHLSLENIPYENLVVIDIFGKIILEQNYYSPKILVQHLPSSIYFLKIRSENRTYTCKFIKE